MKSFLITALTAVVFGGFAIGTVVHELNKFGKLTSSVVEHVQIPKAKLSYFDEYVKVVDSEEVDANVLYESNVSPLKVGTKEFPVESELLTLTTEKDGVVYSSSYVSGITYDYKNVKTKKANLVKVLDTKSGEEAYCLIRNAEVDESDKLNIMDTLDGTDTSMSF